ncbi:MAG TPA: retron system putative HNH endonuclease [Thermoanaerobaculia bacterium]
MIRLDRTRVRVLAKWNQHVQKALPDLDAFRAKAGEFENLDIDDPVRRKGFTGYGSDVLPKKKGGICYFKSIWGKAKRALAAMSHQKCAYCETHINAERSGQVEHFKPKSLFPLLTYEWSNYFLGCGGCNGAKSDKWPVGGVGYVRPDEGDPFSLFHFLEDGTMAAVDPTGPAKHTVEDLDLNREWLRRLRAIAIEGTLTELKDLLAEVGVTEDARERLARNAHARLLSPELAYSAAVRQCFERAWRTWRGVPL